MPRPTALFILFSFSLFSSSSLVLGTQQQQCSCSCSCPAVATPTTHTITVTVTSPAAATPAPGNGNEGAQANAGTRAGNQNAVVVPSPSPPVEQAVAQPTSLADVAPIALGGDMQHGVSALALDANRWDLFARGWDNKLWYLKIDNGRPSPWEPLPVSPRTAMNSAVSCTQWGAERTDCFVGGTEGRFFQATKTATTAFESWNKVPGGGKMTGSPSCLSAAPGKIDCFARAEESGEFLRISFRNGNWLPWERLPGTSLTSSPACTLEQGTDAKIVCVARCQGGHGVHFRELSLALGTPPQGDWTLIAPAVGAGDTLSLVSVSSTVLRVFVRDGMGRLRTAVRVDGTWKTNNWPIWDSVIGDGPLAAIHRRDGTSWIHTFVLSGNRRLGYRAIAEPELPQPTTPAPTIQPLQTFW